MPHMSLPQKRFQKTSRAKNSRPPGICFFQLKIRSRDERVTDQPTGRYQR